MDKGAILILGGGIMQIPAIETAKKLGWRVILADGDNSAPGVACADTFLHIDLKETEALIEKAKELKNRGLRGVFTAGTDFSTTVASVAESCGLPGIPVKAALNAKDKGRMRECFRQAGIPSPAFTVITGSDVPKLEQDLRFPLVVKPSDNMGARGVRRVDTYEELNASFLDAVQFSGEGKVVVEEYIRGPEFSLDALVYDGSIDICGFADRHIRFFPYFVEMGHTMPTCLPRDRQQEVIDIFKAGIRALGITEGAAKGDIKYTEKGPVVGEIAARLSGGYMSGWTYPYASGYNVTEAALRIAVGERPSGKHSGYPCHSAERAFISIPGIVKEISGLPAADRTFGVKNCFLRTEAGKRAVFPKNNIEKCGNIISQAASREAAVKAAEEGVRSVFIRLEPGNIATENFLFGPDREGWPPPAFVLRKEENISELKIMPLYTPSRRDNRAVLMLPDLDSEDGKDWHGMILRDALERAEEIIGEDMGKLPGALGRIFWAALLRGGLQGAVWVFDTLLEADRVTNDFRRKLEKWSRLL